MEEDGPKIGKIQEIELLCKIYRAKLFLIAGNVEAAKAMLKGTQKLLKVAVKEPGLFPASMLKDIHSQYVNLIRSIKAEQVGLAYY